MVAGLGAENRERDIKSLLGNDIARPGLTYSGKRADEALGKSYGHASPSAWMIEPSRRDFEYGDPADDVTCLTLNYVFFSMPCSGGPEVVFDPT